jgi:hypothetical protein
MNSTVDKGKNLPLVNLSTIEIYLYMKFLGGNAGPVDMIDWRELASRNEWREFLDLFFLISVIWVRRVNSVRVGHTRTIECGNRLFII